MFLCLVDWLAGWILLGIFVVVVVVVVVFTLLLCLFGLTVSIFLGRIMVRGSIPFEGALNFLERGWFSGVL